MLVVWTCAYHFICSCYDCSTNFCLCRCDIVWNRHHCMDSSSDNMDNNISVAPSRMGSNRRSDIIYYTNRNTI